MKRLLSLIVLLCCTTLVSAQSPAIEHLQTMTSEVAELRTLTESMPPFFAQKYLRGDAYSAWAIQHNEAAYRNARRDPGQHITVTDTNVRQYGNGGFGLYIGNNNGNRQAATRSGLPQTSAAYGNTSVRTYNLNGGSSPVMIYNPYVTPE